jgi:hypothetical protein
MATKSDFTQDEWRTLRDAPHLVVVAAASAGGSGLFGTLKEAIAPAGAMVEAIKGNNDLLKALCDKEEMKAAVDEIKEGAKATDFKEVQSYFHQQAVNKSREALAIVKAKGTADDAKAYADFLMNLGNRVANAAKEGDFLGFGGERVSEGERVLLGELGEALGVAVDQTFKA